MFGKKNEEVYDVWPEMPEQAVHTPERPFCWDMTCYCHYDHDAIEQTAQDIRDGLLSPDDADRIYRGRMV